MVSIQLSTGTLDTYNSTELQLQWTAFRFQTALRDPYSNDITIPKTKNNVRVLSAAGMLDSQTQMFGDKTYPADLTVDSFLMPIYLQVVAIRKDEIDICLYEDRFPQELKDRLFNVGLIDTSSTIYEWNENSVHNYPDAFKSYRYGITYNTEFAQYHPSVSLDFLLQGTSFGLEYQIPNIASTYRMLCSRKKVCPQNHTQVIEVQWTDGNFGVMRGGNHITNDLVWSWNPDAKEIRFNRQCNVTMDVYVSYDLKGNHYSGTSSPSDKFFQLIMIREGNYPHQADIMFLPDDGQNGVFSHTWQVAHNYVQNGTVFKIEAREQASWYNTLNAVIVMNITDYEIDEEDYDVDLDYVGRLPRLLVTSRTSLTNMTDDYRYFDGSNFTYTKRKQWHQNTIETVTLPRLSLSYFGAYCNLPQIKLSDLLFSLQWIIGKKLRFSHANGLYWTNAYEEMNIDGIIQEIRPHSDYLGQNNYIKYKNGNTADPIFTIQNTWLDKDKTLFQSAFIDPTYHQKYNWPPEIEQYSDAEYDDNGNPEVKFEEPDGPVVLNWVSTIGMRTIRLKDFDLPAITQCMEVDITTYEPLVREADIVYVNGRAFFVISGSTNLRTKASKLKGLLISGVIGTSNTNHNPDQPYDPYDPYDPDPHDPDYPYEPDDPDQPDYPDPYDPHDPYGRDDD